MHRRRRPRLIAVFVVVVLLASVLFLAVEAIAIWQWYHR
jgi:cytochrome c-type biogenesis protein CcmE